MLLKVGRSLATLPMHIGLYQLTVTVYCPTVDQPKNHRYIRTQPSAGRDNRQSVQND